MDILLVFKQEPITSAVVIGVFIVLSYLILKIKEENRTKLKIVSFYILYIFAVSGLFKYFFGLVKEVNIAYLASIEKQEPSLAEIISKKKITKIKVEEKKPTIVVAKPKEEKIASVKPVAKKLEPKNVGVKKQEISKQIKKVVKKEEPKIDHKSETKIIKVYVIKEIEKEVVKIEKPQLKAEKKEEEQKCVHKKYSVPHMKDPLLKMGCDEEFKPKFFLAI